MAAEKATLIYQKNADLTIGGVSFADAITNCALNITSTTEAFVPISGEKQTQVGEPEAEVVIEFAQTFVEGELFHTLMTGHGTTAELVFKPAGGTAPVVSANVTLIAPTSVGGGVGLLNTTATLPVNGAFSITYVPDGEGE